MRCILACHTPFAKRSFHQDERTDHKFSFDRQDGRASEDGLIKSLQPRREREMMGRPVERLIT